MKSFKLQWRYDVDVRALALGAATLVVGLVALFFAGQAQRSETRTGVLKSAIPARMAAMSSKREKPVERPNETARSASDRRNTPTSDGTAELARSNTDVVFLNSKPAAGRGAIEPQIGEPFVMRQDPGLADMNREVSAAAPETQIINDAKSIDIEMETETVAAVNETVVAIEESRIADVARAQTDAVTADIAAATPSETIADAKSTDVLQEWSAAKLELIRNGRPKQHRLAKNYPEHDIVVCEAGCRRQVEQIVFMAPKPVRNPRRQARMITTASGSQRLGDTDTASGNIECLAGCYRTPRAYRPRRQVVGARSGQGRRRAARNWR